MAVNIVHMNTRSDATITCGIDAINPEIFPAHSLFAQSVLQKSYDDLTIKMFTPHYSPWTSCECTYYESYYLNCGVTFMQS
jgi:hypothetical protein